MNLTNQALTNVFSKALIANTNAPRYAKASFAELVSATMLTKAFQRAIKSAETLFGVAVENKVIKRKLARKEKNKHAKVQKAVSGAPKAKRGRPLGSKNKPKVAGIEPAQSKPLVDPTENTQSGITQES